MLPKDYEIAKVPYEGKLRVIFPDPDYRDGVISWTISAEKAEELAKNLFAMAVTAKREKELIKEEMKHYNFIQMEMEFNRKYNPYPYSPSPATIFGEALKHGDITEHEEMLAAKYYGKRWFYSSD